MYSIFTNIYLMEGDKIFFLHRAADKAVWPDALLGVGGKVEPGEELYAAALREFQEEAGATPTDLKLVGTLSWLDDDNQNGINYIFVATKYTGELLASCDEGNFEWINVREAMVDPRTAAHQLRYLPYLVRGEHFSQHMHFRGAFSEGNITKDFNSVSYTNHRLAKGTKSIGIATDDAGQLAFINTILSPYGITAIHDDKGVSIDTTIHAAGQSVGVLSADGLEKAVDAVQGDGLIRATLEYAVCQGDESSSVLIPAQLTQRPVHDDTVHDDVPWSFLQFAIEDDTKRYANLSAEERADVFGLLAQAIMACSSRS